MRRRLALILVLALAAIAGFWLLRSTPQPTDVSAEPESDAHADIDDASRAALERVLEDADRREAHGEAPRDAEPGR